MAPPGRNDQAKIVALSDVPAPPDLQALRELLEDRRVLVSPSRRCAT
jgi:hypothetical protein